MILSGLHYSDGEEIWRAYTELFKRALDRSSWSRRKGRIDPVGYDMNTIGGKTRSAYEVVAARVRNRENGLIASREVESILEHFHHICREPLGFDEMKSIVKSNAARSRRKIVYARPAAAESGHVENVEVPLG